MDGFAIARYLSNGDLDATFGTGGIVTIDMGMFVLGISVKIRSDNSIIVCGNSRDEKIAIAHIRSNGDLDLDASGSEAKYSSSYMDDQEHPTLRKVMFTQPDQVLASVTKENQNTKRKSSLLNWILTNLAKIKNIFVGVLKFLHIIPRSFSRLRVLAVGDVGELVSPRFIAVAGYTINANSDQSFGNNGQIIQHAGSDKIEVAAADYNSRKAKTVIITHKHDNDLRVLRIARFLDDGTLDGFVSYAAWLTESSGSPWNIQPHDMVFRNEIIIVGRGSRNSVNGALIVVRIKENGSVDLNFGEIDGVGFIRDPGSQSAFNSVDFDARSRIIAAGSNASDNFCLARFNPNGKFDENFNQNNLAVTDFDGDNSKAEVAKIDSVISERIVVAGEAGNQFALTRYLENGSLDSTFGTNGKVRTNILSNHTSSITDIAFDNQQRIIAAGSVHREIIIE